MATTFEDNFSRQSKTYALHRPTYPAELFAFIASIAPAHHHAWDAGTGSGQAAVALAGHFEHVTATDASADQLAHAQPHERVTYLVAPAERTGIPTGSADAVTAATAAHWFNLEGFYAEVRRVLKPGGVVVLWSYFTHRVDPVIDPIMRRLSLDIVGPYWSKRLTAVDGTYAELPFPFEEIAAPPFAIEMSWTLDALLGYLASWSAVQKFIDTHGRDPIDEVRADLEAAWGPASTERIVRWNLTMRAGRYVPQR